VSQFVKGLDNLLLIEGALPYEHLATDQETALVNGSCETLFRRNLIGCGEVLGESRIVVGRHKVSEEVVTLIQSRRITAFKVHCA
jgi:hypothetical protein